MTGMLASVSNLDEALHVATAGVDIIDLKAPAAGALGALDHNDIETIVERLPSECVISATVGDLPMQPDILSQAVNDMNSTGVDYIKIGFFPGGDWSQCIDRIAHCTKNDSQLIAVFFGDRNPDLKWLDNLATAGFSGVMLDTLNKQTGSLLKVYSFELLKGFIDSAKKQGFLCGLAGSLQQKDIDKLLQLDPDYLGFRGALCHQRQRTDRLDPIAVKNIRDSIPLVQNLDNVFSA